MVWPGASVAPFDVGHGDANELHKFVAPKSVTTVHASQCLEHMHSPMGALLSWAQVAREFLVFTVPDFVHYEKLNWPSKWNPDHKSTWSDYLKASPAGENHVYVPKFLSRVEVEVGKVLRYDLVTTNYDFTAGPEKDQTFVYEDGVECFHEFVVKL